MASAACSHSSTTRRFVASQRPTAPLALRTRSDRTCPRYLPRRIQGIPEFPSESMGRAGWGDGGFSLVKRPCQSGAVAVARRRRPLRQAVTRAGDYACNHYDTVRYPLDVRSAGRLCGRGSTAAGTAQGRALVRGGSCRVSTLHRGLLRDGVLRLRRLALGERGSAAPLGGSALV